MGMDNLLKCTEDNFCEPLESRLQNYKPGGVKGFIRYKKENNKFIPAYSVGRTDRGLVFKFCPFCGFSFNSPTMG